MRQAAVTIAALCALAGVMPASAAAAPALGCAPRRPAIAHYAGGVVLHPQPSRAPIPCGTQTGFAGGESAIAVTNDGAVFYAPAVQTFAGTQAQYFLGGNSGFARTINGGVSWSFVDPVGLNTYAPAVPGIPSQRLSGSLGYPAWDQIDDKFYMDHTTGRLFWTDPDVPSEVVLYTDDDGLSWNYSVLPIGFGGEWTQVTAAKPRISTTNGYPEVVYACGEYDSVSRDGTTKLEGDLCQKSLDGGQSWIVAGQGFFGSPVATHPQCNGTTESPNFSPWAAPDPQGRLYELLFCDGKTFLVRSSDEGATWPIYVRVPYSIPNVGPGDTGAAELRTDAVGNLYLAWSNPGNPNPNGPYSPSKVYLGVSHDSGRTWSPAREVLAPGVQGIRTHFGFDVTAPGHVAFSYLGHTGSRNGFDGYITETADALAARPLFWSAIVNDPTQAPLDNGGKGSSNGLGLDYVSAAIAPDGAAWGSFWDDCGEDLPQTNAGCTADRQEPGVTVLGFVDYAGRLTAPPAIGLAGLCPPPSGRLAGMRLGPLALGMTRARAQAVLSRHAPIGYGFENFCLNGGPGIRVHYRNGRIVIALSANRSYSLDGVKPGTPLSAAARRLHLGAPFHIGLNYWYLTPGRVSTGVLKVRHGAVEEVGIASLALTRGRKAQAAFLEGFS